MVLFFLILENTKRRRNFFSFHVVVGYIIKTFFLGHRSLKSLSRLGCCRLRLGIELQPFTKHIGVHFAASSLRLAPGLVPPRPRKPLGSLGRRPGSRRPPDCQSCRCSFATRSSFKLTIEARGAHAPRDLIVSSFFSRIICPSRGLKSSFGRFCSSFCRRDLKETEDLWKRWSSEN